VAKNTRDPLKELEIKKRKQEKTELIRKQI